MDPTTTAARVAEAINAAIVVGILLGVYFFLSHRSADGEPTRWQRLYVWFYERYLTSSTTAVGAAGDDLADGEIAGNSPEKRNGETGESGVAMGKSEGNDPFQFPDLFTGLARLVLANEIGETDALKLAVKASPGKSPRYAEARDRLHAAMARERPPASPQFPPLTEEQQALRDELRLPQRS